MASNLARAKLASAACALNRRRPLQKRALPALLFLTDQERVADPCAAARALPKGAAIILRHRDSATRAALARELQPIAQARGLKLLVAGDPALAARAGLAGAHFPEAQIAELSRWRLHADWLLTAAAHSEHAALRALRAGADAVLLAPVFPTRSHPGKSALGVLRARLIASRVPLPVYALGGITARNVGRLSGANLAGLAAIEALLPG
jgi:thiamine-phosphate pyrophosphorylase